MAAAGCGFNYVVTANKPTVVTFSEVGNFTGENDLNLILAKSTRLEIWTLTADGLKGVADVPIYGRIATLQLFRPPGEDKDLIFLSTERYMFCVLAWDTEKGELVTRANGNVEDKVGRPVEDGQLGIVDPHCRLIGLHLYDGLFKVIPINAEGKLQEAYNIRLEEQCVVDLKFLHTPAGARPTLAVLFEDTRRARHIKTYEVGLREKELHDGPWSQRDLDGGASLIIPIPAPVGGAVVIGENVIAYFSEDAPPKVTPIQPTIITAYGKVDEDGSRWLLGDHVGRLWLLVLGAAGGRVNALRLEALGTTSPPSTLSYLDNGVVYVGSQRGDSQLVRLSATPVGGDEAPPGGPPSFLEVLESYTSLGPIVDFAVVDLERQGQGQVVTCSGVGDGGSLRIVRNGIGMIEQATVELPGIKGIWSLKASSVDAFDTYLVLTFVGETRVLAITPDDELDEAELPGFDADAQTLHCGNAAADQIVQITRQSLRLIDAGTRQLTQEWRPPDGMTINVAAASPTQALLAVGDGDLVALSLSDGKATETAHIKLDSEIACLDITPLGEESDAATFAAVGTWAMGLRTYRLPDLMEAASEELGGEVIPRSVLIADFEAGPHLLCALGDGVLFNFRLDPATGALSERKRVSLGTKPITLRSFRSGGARHVFAASDRPTVIYSANKKLLYSNVNEDEVNFMTSFNSSSFPDSLAIAKEGSMTIGTIDEIQKLHIRTVPLGENPRRIAHQEAARAFAVVVEATDFSSPDQESVAVRLLDDQTFETTDRFALDPSEKGASLISGSFADDPAVYYILGTAYAYPDEPEPTKGRILVLQAREGKLSLVSEKETRGCVYSLNVFQGKLLASINNRVQLYGWSQREGGARELTAECGHSGHVCALCVDTCGDFILVGAGDMMKSMQLLVYKAEEGAISVRARDYNTNWVTASTMLDEDTYLAAENSYNLYTLARNSDAAADEERNHLEEVGSYHVGDFVNRFRAGSLVMKLPDSEAAAIPTQLFGTIAGVIGLVASLPRHQFEFLTKLQSALRGVIKGVGGFDHAEWRAFRSERTTAEAKGFVDGDLIEQFLDLRPDGMAAVAAAMGGDTSVEELSKAVEELSRLH